MKKRSLLGILALTALLAGTFSHLPVASAAVKDGGGCNSAGKVTSVGSIKFTCIKSGKKLIWKKNVIKPAVEKPQTPVNTTPTVETANLPKFQSEGCHAKVSATLQKLSGSTWVDVTEAQGWELVSDCDANHPYEPYARVSLPEGTTIRWRVYSPGNWEWFSTTKTVKTLIVPTVGEKIPAIDPQKYAEVAQIARNSIYNDMPTTTNLVPVTYTFESSIFPQTQSLIKSGVTSALSRYSPYFDSTKDIHIFVFGSSDYLKNEAPKADPTNKVFADDMARESLKWGGRNPSNCSGFGGFAVPNLPFPFIALDAPCSKNDDAAYGVLPHELTHSLQLVLGDANSRCWAPVWLVEGQAQVGGSALATTGSASAYDLHRASWVKRIVKPGSTAEILSMEGETTDLSEYTLGAALSEYLIAKGGWLKSLKLYTQASKQVNSSCLSGSAKLDNFNQAFLSLYGESVKDFYAEALPYLQWVATNR